MTDDEATTPAEWPPETPVQDWAAAAHRLISEQGRDGVAAVLADDFVQESRRGVGFRFDREALLGTVRSMRELGMQIRGTPVAVAGDRWLLTKRVYQHGSTAQELLAVSDWNEAGKLRRLIEFDVADVDDALATLREVSGDQDVVMLSDPPAAD